MSPTNLTFLVQPTKSKVLGSTIELSNGYFISASGVSTSVVDSIDLLFDLVSTIELAYGCLIAGTRPFRKLVGMMVVLTVLGSTIDFSNGNLIIGAGACDSILGLIDLLLAPVSTIELINPEFDIFYELGRTVKKGMFLVLSENGHSYPRFYRLLHKLNGFEICSVTSITDGAVLIHSVKKQ